MTMSSAGTLCLTTIILPLLITGKTTHQAERNIFRLRRQLPSEINIQVTAPLFTARLFDFGLDEGDQLIPADKAEALTPLHLQYPFQYYSKRYEKVYISSNGAIGFDSKKPAKNSSSILIGKQPLIAPFWNRNDLRKGGNVYYRELTSGRLLDRAKSEVLYQFERTAPVSSILIVTWHMMQPFEGQTLPDENTNTFQAVIVIAGNDTFANFIYKSIGWTQGAEAGFVSGEDNENFYALPTSGSADVTYLKEYGNTGIPGEWMFQVDWHRVVRCKAGVKGDTCDTECAENEWGEDCIHCCFCSTGRCNIVTGECASKECKSCWLNPPYCNTYDSACTPKQVNKCAPNAVFMLDYDKCGQPLTRCHCLAGYEGDGYKCKDIDECKGDHNCHKHADCINVPGSHFCQCQAGYAGNGTHCSKSTSEITEMSTTSTRDLEEPVQEYVQAELTTDKQILPRRSNSHLSYTLNQPMMIFGKTVQKLTVSSNGLVTLNGILPVSPEDPLEMAGVVGFAPYYSAIDLSRSMGTVSVQETSNAEMLTEASIMIARHFPSLDFMANSIVMVAFENVSTAQVQEMSNTFLVVLMSGKNPRGELLTFVDYVYEDLKWTEYAQASVIPQNQNEILELPGSGTDAVRLLSHLSNIQMPGQWLFRVDHTPVQFCSNTELKPPYCESPGEEVISTTTAADEEAEEWLTHVSERISTTDSPIISAVSESTTESTTIPQTLLIKPSVLRVQLVTQATTTAWTNSPTTEPSQPVKVLTQTPIRHSISKPMETTSRAQPIDVRIPTTTPVTTPVPRNSISSVTSYINQVKKKPVPVLDGSSDFVTTDDEELFDPSSQMAIIIPAAIVGIWLILLLTIGIVVCCRRKLNKRRFRRTYEANYHFDPMTTGTLDGVKRSMITIPSRSSYESVLTDYSSSTDGKRLGISGKYSQPTKPRHNGFSYSKPNSGNYNYFNQTYYNPQPEFSKYSYTEKLPSQLVLETEMPTAPDGAIHFLKTGCDTVSHLKIVQDWAADEPEEPSIFLKKMTSPTASSFPSTTISSNDSTRTWRRRGRIRPKGDRTIALFREKVRNRSVYGAMLAESNVTLAGQVQQLRSRLTKLKLCKQQLKLEIGQLDIQKHGLDQKLQTVRKLHKMNKHKKFVRELLVDVVQNLKSTVSSTKDVMEAVGIYEKFLNRIESELSL